MRTNIDIDDELMKQAMEATGARTKKAVVDAALRQVVQLKKQERIRDLFGTIVWRGHDDDWFASDEEIREKYRAASADPRNEPQVPNVPLQDVATPEKQTEL